MGRGDLHSRIDRAVGVVEESQVPSYRSHFPVLWGELSRSRRYKRPLSIAVLGLQRDHLPSPLVRLAQNNESPERQLLTRTTQMLSFAFGLIVAESVRDSDIVTYVPGDDRFVLVLAESDRSHALRTVKRLAALLHQRLDIHLQAGVAEFPSDGLTLDELVARASSTLSPIVSNNASSSPGGKG